MEKPFKTIKAYSFREYPMIVISARAFLSAED